MNNDDKLLKEGISKAFEAFEATRRVVADEMLMKATTLVGIMIAGEAKGRREEGDALVESITKDEEKIDKLSKLIELKEEYVKLFEE